MKITNSFNCYFEILIVSLVTILLSITMLNNNDLIINSLISLKTFSFIFVTCVILIFFFISNIFKSIEIRLDVVDLTIIFFSIYIFLTNYLRNIVFDDYSIAFLLSILLYLFIKNLLYKSLNNKKLIIYLIVLILFIGLYEVVFGQLQLLKVLRSNHKLYNITGTFHNPGPYGIYLSVIFSISFSFIIFLNIKSNFYCLKQLFILTAFLSFTILPTTQSRSAWIGISISICFNLFLKYQSFLKEINYKKLLFLSLAITLICFVALIALYLYKPGSVIGRSYVWLVCISSIFDHPFLGIGYGQFQYHYGELNSIFVLKNQNNLNLINHAQYVNYAFNDYLQILVENGLIGFLIFLSFVWFTLKKGFDRILKNGEPEVLAAFSGIITIFVSAFFSYPFELVTIWFVLLILISIVTLYNVSIFTIEITSYKKIVFNLACIIITSYTLVDQIYILQNKVLWKKADDKMSNQDFEGANDLYKNVYARSTNYPLMMLGYGKSLYMYGDIKKSISVLNRAKNYISDPFLYSTVGDCYFSLKSYDDAEKNYYKSISILPNRIYPRYLLVKLLVQKGDSLEAKKLARQIIMMPVPVTSASHQRRNEKNLILSLYEIYFLLLSSMYAIVWLRKI